MGILAKMMRIAGRGYDGTAKAIATNNEGHLLTQPVGGLVEQITEIRNDIASLEGKDFATEQITEIRNDIASLEGKDFATEQTLMHLLNASISADSVFLASGADSVQGVIAKSGLELVGFSIVEDALTPAPARIRIHSGTDNTDPILFDVVLSPSESIREYYQFGIKSEEGIYIDRVSGTTQITLFVREVEII